MLLGTWETRMMMTPHVVSTVLDILQESLGLVEAVFCPLGSEPDSGVMGFHT